MGDAMVDENNVTGDSKARESKIGVNGRLNSLDVNCEIASENMEKKSRDLEESRSGNGTHPSSSDLSPLTAEFDNFDDDEVRQARKKSKKLTVSLKTKLRELSPSRRSPKPDSTKTERRETKIKSLSKSPKTSTGWLPASFNQIFSNYKNKCTDFRRLFKDLPDSEQLIIDYSCALQKDILVHGRLYISQNWLCFYANIFGWETFVTIKCINITFITKEKTALVIPNAIQICTGSEKYFFASLVSRDSAYSVLFRIWQNALLDQPLSPQELRNIVGRYEDFHDGSSGNASDDDDDDDEEEEEEEEEEDDDGNCSESADEGSAEGMSSSGSEGNNDVNEKLTTTLDQIPMGSKPSLLTISSDSSNHQNNMAPGGRKTPPSLAVTPPTPQKKTTSMDFGTSPKAGRKNAGQLKTTTQKTADSSNGKKESSDLEEEGTASEHHEEEKLKTPVQCPCDKHWSNHLLNEEYNVNVDTLFEHLFTESDFYKKLQKGRKTKELKFKPWVETEDGQRRKITYTISLNYPIGPKTSPTTEEQRCLKESVPNKMYIVECEVTNEGIPYGDTFTVCTRHCITRITDTSCRLRVTSKIKFVKSVWGFVKNMIEKNAVEGLDGYFKFLASSLKKMIEPGRHTGRKRKGAHPTRHKRNRSIHDKDNGLPSAAAQEPAAARHVEKQSTIFKGMLPRINLLSLPVFQLNTQKAFTVFIALLLASLFVVNLSLIRRLQNVENSAYYRQDWSLKDLPTDSQEWAKLLEQQRHLQQQEMSRWQEILTTSMQLMTQVQRSLQELSMELNKPTNLEKQQFAEKNQEKDNLAT